MKTQTNETLVVGQTPLQDMRLGQFVSVLVEAMRVAPVVGATHQAAAHAVETEDFGIEHTIPMPTSSESDLVIVLNAMKEGDSKEFSEKQIHSVRNAAYKLGIRTIVRKAMKSDGSYIANTVRVWHGGPIHRRKEIAA